MQLRQRVKAIRKAWKVSGWMQKDTICTGWKNKSRLTLFKKAYNLETKTAKASKEQGSQY